MTIMHFQSTVFAYDQGPLAVFATPISDVESLHDGSGVTIGIKVQRNGEIWIDEGSGYALDTDWTDQKSTGVGDDFEVFMDDTTGTWTSGTTDSWLALTSDREWTSFSTGDKTVIFTLSVRNVTNTSNEDTQAGITFDIVLSP